MIAGVIQRGIGRGAARARRPLTLNITSMIDVVFLLMMYFLLIAQVRGREEAIGVTLPPVAAQTPGESRQSPIEEDPFRVPETSVTVTVRSVGDGAQQHVVSVEGLPAGVAGPITSMAELTGVARSARGRVLGPEQRWVIRAGGDARWEHTLAAMTALRDADFRNIRFGDPVP